MKITSTVSLSLLLALILYSCNGPAERNIASDNILWLKNDPIVLGILPDVGGRLVYFGVDRDHNFLKSDSTLWNEADSQRIQAALDAPWKAYNGHIAWLGPQSSWWTQQEIDVKRKEEKAMWPPDPWLEYGQYDIIEESKSKIVLEGPLSPVSGIQFTKTYEIKNNSTVIIKVLARNISQKQLAWDLWLNTRIEGRQKVYVPLSDMNDLATWTEYSETTDTIDYEITDGYFSYLETGLSPTKKEAFSKAFIRPSEPWMATFQHGYCFIQEFEAYEDRLGHPEQAMVEIYTIQTSQGKADMTEMEYHGPFTKLLPGDSLSTTMTWRLIPLHGSEAGAAFLDSVSQNL